MMNTVKNKKNNKNEPAKRGFFKSLMGLINGNALVKEEVLSHMPFLLFLALIALLYIVNGYWAENSVRSINKASVELKELRSEYITTKSDLMFKSKQSEISSIIKIKKMGIEESVVPPKKIAIEQHQELVNAKKD